MFTKEGEKNVDTVNTTIGAGTVLTGDVRVEGSIRVDGEFEGKVEATDTLIVGESGRVEGNATVANAMIGGRMFGNVFASGKIELQRGSQLLGDIETRGLVIEDGVVFQGNCHMGEVADGPVRRRDEIRSGFDIGDELEEDDSDV
jgi:cytoskeletal protein CcmA (bactofilin family)